MKTEIPNSFRLKLDRLYDNAVAITMEWHIVENLFYESPERIEILRQSASTFFFNCHQALLKDIFLSMARFIDKRKDTLSLRRLYNDSKQFCKKEELDRIASILSEAENLCSVVEPHRKMLLAHLNLSLVTNPTEIAVPPDVERQVIENAISKVKQFIQAVAEAVLQESYLFAPIQAVGGPEVLVNILERGLKAFEQDRQMRTSSI